MFISVGLFVCLLVCMLYVCNIKGICVKGYSRHFQDKWNLAQGTIWNIWGCSINPLNTGFCYILVSVSSTTENGDMDFHEIFMKCWISLDYSTVPILGTASCLKATLWISGWMDFHETVRIGQHKEETETFGDVVLNPLDTWNFFVFWFLIPCLFFTMGGFHEIFKLSRIWH